MVFLNPQGPNIMVWTLQCFGKDFLFKFILTGCEVFHFKMGTAVVVILIIASAVFEENYVDALDLHPRV